MAMNPAIQTTNKDRRLYIWFAALMPLIVLAGFARTYYLKGFFGTPSLPGLLVHLHGLVDQHVFRHRRDDHGPGLQLAGRWAGRRVRGAPLTRG